MEAILAMVAVAAGTHWHAAPLPLLLVVHADGASRRVAQRRSSAIRTSNRSSVRSMSAAAAARISVRTSGRRPGFDSIDDRVRPLVPELVPQGLCRGVAGKPARDEPLDGIEVPISASISPHAAGQSVAVRLKLAFRVRPAVRQREAGPVTGQDLVHRVAVDDGGWRSRRVRGLGTSQPWV